MEASPAASTSARRLFDGMPPNKEGKKPPEASSVDRIGALPDDILHHLLSFLLAQEAVRTCVLARRWRHLWKFTTGLRIIYVEDDGGCHGSIQELRKFVDHLLNLRGHNTGLDNFEIKFSKFLGYDVLSPITSTITMPYVNQWTRFALLCRVRALTLHLYYYRMFLDLDGLPLVSGNLRTLDLQGVCLRRAFLDFSGCPVLEDLKTQCCQIDVDKISSLSLKRLSIEDCRSTLDRRVCISVPGLISFTIDRFEGIISLFETMPMLEAANVELGHACCDVCHILYKSDVFGGADGPSCEFCPASNDGGSNAMLIYNAKHLKLIFPLGMVIFARDLKSCPTFNKLKTLLLTDYWCAGPD